MTTELLDVPVPGRPFPAPADTYPRKDDVADYLADQIHR